MKKILSLLGCLIITASLAFVAKSQVTDVEGNTYHTVQIGTQLWMKENLKTTKFNDGTAITLVPDSALWITLTTPGFCWCNKAALYNFYTVADKRGVCPTGWHIPLKEEWNLLISFIGKEQVKLMLMSVDGFAAILLGSRSSNGRYIGLGLSNSWWSSTESSTATDRAVSFALIGNVPGFYLGAQYKRMGYSVRCLKDN
jgi:uncharacterized protein (TIGR02145 family)